MILTARRMFCTGIAEEHCVPLHSTQSKFVMWESAFIPTGNGLMGLSTRDHGREAVLSHLELERWGQLFSLTDSAMTSLTVQMVYRIMADT